MNIKLLTTAAWGLLLLTSFSAFAEQRALLVGVGEYQNPENNLPAIDLDLDRMVDTLKIMGFESSEIHTLLDEESTAENILQEMNTWLVDGVTEDDRVVFYYSGHGSFVPDENGDETEDGVDEVLVAHDVQVVRRNGKATLEGIITDDQVALAIQRSASKNFLTIVDACHSGTVTRNLFLKNQSLTNEEVFEKTLTYEDMPVGFNTSIARDVSLASRNGDAGNDTFVSISAAGDSEKAIGSSRGGFFTIGFSDAIIAAAKMNEPISLFDARDAAEEFIRSRLDPQRVHTPQITGNLGLAESVLSTNFLTGGNGPMWQRLEELVGEGQYFPLGTGKPSYLVDETIIFSMDIKEPGYLNLISVDAEDTATVLFPNAADNDNLVPAGRFEFPTAKSGFDFIAAPPLGPTLVLAFISEEPINFRDFGYEGRLPSGDFDPQSVFTNVTHSVTRAIKVRINAPTSAPVSASSEPTPEPGADDMAMPIPDVEVDADDADTPVVVATGSGDVPEPDASDAPEIESDESDQPWLYASSLEISVREK